MFVIAEEIDKCIYVDLIISPKELTKLKQHEMVSGEGLLMKKRYYFGVKLQGNWDFYEEESKEDVEG